jgi:hypothetical protein
MVCALPGSCVCVALARESRCTVHEEYAVFTHEEYAVFMTRFSRGAFHDELFMTMQEFHDNTRFS